MSTSVVIIGPAYPLRGGLSSFNERLERQFLSEGYHTEIVTFSLQYPAFLFPGTTQYSTEPAPNDITIKESINSINPFNWIKVGWALKKKRPDIIVVRFWLPFMGPCLGTILRIVRLNKHTKIVCIADNIIPHEKRFGDVVFTKYFLKPIDSFITMSQKVLADLKLFSSKPAQFVAHPLYDNFGEVVNRRDARIELTLPIESKIILFFGFIRKYKGLDLLLEAIYILKEKKYFESNPTIFLIAGEFYEDPQSYLDMIETYSIGDYIILKNEFISDTKVKYYLSASDCVIQPYKNATQSGVTPLAYHFEKPMIVTNVGGLPALVPNTIGMIAEPNAISIADTIEEFFRKDVKAFEMNIKEEKKKFSWDKITKAIVSVVKN